MPLPRTSDTAVRLGSLSGMVAGVGNVQSPGVCPSAQIRGRGDSTTADVCADEGGAQAGRDVAVNTVTAAFTGKANWPWRTPLGRVVVVVVDQPAIY